MDIVNKDFNQANDYALAKCFNERAWRILWYVADLYPLYPHDLDKVNRNYIFLVKELLDIYDRNEELRDIRPKPSWQLYKHVDGYEKEIADLQDDRTGDTGQIHTASVTRLCILNGKEDPDLTEQQEQLITEADEIISVMGKEIDKEKAHAQAMKERRQIAEYKLSYDELRGKIIINDVYQLNKRSTNDGSNIDKLLKQALSQPNKAFVPQLNTTKNLSTILNNAGFDPLLRQLFFPTARKGKGVFCRPIVTRAEADDEGIDTTNLDLKLKELGAN